MLATALGCAALMASCGRGPVEPQPGPPLGKSITFQLFVSGQINPSQGNYIIAINTNVDAATNVNPGEVPGEPTAQEAQGNPAPYTHWDQEFVYGSSTLLQPNGFSYNYKALTGGSGINRAQFFPIVLNTNDYTFISNGNAGTGTGNMLSMTLPIDRLSIRASSAGSTPGITQSPPVTFIYVNFVTTDSSQGGRPVDQLGAQGINTQGFAQPVDLRTPGTIPLPNFANKTGGPTNPNLFITGGQIIVQP